MKVTFSVYQQKKDITLDVEVLSTVPVRDTFLLITRYKERCILSSGKESSPYNAHLIRAVDHLVYGVVDYVNRRSIVLAACLCGGELYYALIQQDYLDDNISLGTANDQWEGVSGDRVELFNFEQYAASRRALALDVPSISDFVSDLISANTDELRSVRYNIENERNVKVEELLSDAGLCVWLDKEENSISGLE